MEVAEREANLVATFSNDAFGLTANVRRSGDDFEIIIIDALSGEAVSSIRRSNQEEAEKFASALMHPSVTSSAICLRRGMWSWS